MNKDGNNKIIEYLKSIDENTEVLCNHDELDFNDFLISIVKHTICVFGKKEYQVSIVCVDKKTNSIHSNIELKNFGQEEDADSYYNDLKSSVNEENIKNILNV